MKKFFTLAALMGLIFTWGASAQNYPQVVVYQASDAVTATFTSVGADAKSKNVEDNAVRSLFYTLFYVGVDGFNDGKPLIVNDNPKYVETFFASRMPFYLNNASEIAKPVKNSNKL